MRRHHAARPAAPRAHLTAAAHLPAPPRNAHAGGYTTANASNLAPHARSHSGVMAFMCGEPGCAYGASRRKIVDKHVATKHGGGAGGVKADVLATADI